MANLFKTPCKQKGIARINFGQYELIFDLATAGANFLTIPH